MRTRHARCFVFAALLGTAITANAQDAMPRQPLATSQLVEQVCAACHGVDGNSANAHIPSLAGQVHAYIERQLHMFAAQGVRRANGVMGAIAVNLNADEMNRVASWYSRRALRPAASGEMPLARLGEKMYFEGAPKKDVASCASCHGVRGEGLPDVFPRLAGQHEGYLAEQLRDFRAGLRTTDPHAMMRNVAVNMSDRDIDAVSQYIANLH
ncbi:MAG: c-type cytochrome [Casimicrobiaceae bacterium]